MPVVDADIIVYGAANMVEDDTSIVGGAIDRTIKILGTDMSTTDTLDIVSDNAGDTTQTITIFGRNAAGSLVDTGAVTLTGTTPLVGVVSFERILKIVVSATYLGTITITENGAGGTPITLEGTVDAPGGVAVLQSRRPFYGAEAEASGGSAVVYYEKVFITNTHATLDLTSATITMTFDGSASTVDFDLAAVINDSVTEPNRLTEPDASDMLGAPTWDDAAKIPPGGTLGNRVTAGTADECGTWMRMSLPAGEPPANTFVTFNVIGSST